MALSLNEGPPKRSRRSNLGGLGDEGHLDSAARPTLRALLIEDDSVDAKLIRAYAGAIKSFHLVVETVGSVAEANERLAAQDFDLCITDYWLGHESSLRFMAALRHRPCPVPVIVLTSLSTAEIRTLCLQAGALRVVGKERLSPATLEEAVTAAVSVAGLPEQIPFRAGQAADRGPTLIEGFAQLIQAISGSGLPSRPPHEPGPALALTRAHVRTFAGLSETARFGIFEQLAAARERAAITGAPATAEADLIEAVELARGLIEVQGHTIWFDKPRTPVRLDLDEAALFFLVFELMNRVGEVTAQHGTVSVTIDEEIVSCALHVSGTVRDSAPGLPVTLGALFSRVLRNCRGSIATTRNPEGGPVLVMRFARGARAPNPH